MDSERPWGRHEISDSEVPAGETFETMTSIGKKLWRRILLAPGPVSGKSGNFLDRVVCHILKSKRRYW